MALTKEEWNHAAEKAAAEHFGREHASWYVFKRYGLLPTAVAAGAAAVGWIGYKAWTVAKDVVTGGFAGPPRWSVYCFVALLVLTIVAYRPGRIGLGSLPLTIVKAVFFVGAWAMLVVATVAAV